MDLLLHKILFNIFIFKKILTSHIVKSVIYTKVISNNSFKLLYNSKLQVSLTIAILPTPIFKYLLIYIKSLLIMSPKA